MALIRSLGTFNSFTDIEWAIEMFGQDYSPLRVRTHLGILLIYDDVILSHFLCIVWTVANSPGWERIVGFPEPG